MNCGLIFGNEQVLYIATLFDLWKKEVLHLATILVFGRNKCYILQHSVGFGNECCVLKIFLWGKADGINV
jgi:hypothetical protein